MASLKIIQKVDSCISDFKKNLNEIRGIIQYIEDDKQKFIKKAVSLVSIKLNTIKNIMYQCDTQINDGNIVFKDLYKAINQIGFLMDDIGVVLDEIGDKVRSRDFNPDKEFIRGTINTINNKQCADINNSVKDFSDYVKDLHSRMLFNNTNIDKTMYESLLIDYIGVLSNKDANLKPSGNEYREKKVLYENYCKLVRDYLISKHPHLKDGIPQDKIPKIEITEIKDEYGNAHKVNASFSEKENKIQINYNLLCNGNPVKTAEAIRHELEHWYQSIVTENYAEKPNTRKDIYCNDNGYIYKSYKQYHKMSKENIINICRAIGKEYTEVYVKDVRYAAYSMMMTERLARNAQSKFNADIRNLIKREAPELVEIVWELGEMSKEDLVKKNEKEYKKHKETLDDFMASVLSSLPKFVGIIHEIDDETLGAIFYAMPTEQKNELNEKLENKINDLKVSQEINEKLKHIQQLLVKSIKYDEEIALE